MGGLVISQVAEKIPDKIKALVYLTANLLRNGETSNFEKFFPLFNISQDQRYFTIKSELVANLFYNDCSADDVARAKALLGSEAMAVFKAPVHLSNEKFGRVPRMYIECLRDHTLFPQDQKAMYTTTPCLKVISLNTGHSPFLSAPEKLVDCLLSLAD
jgi:pimeloyl-ACP methyl ester carboxylesterase